MIKILFFANLKELAKTSQLEIEAPDGSIEISSLLDVIGEKCPQINEQIRHPSLLISLNQEVVKGRFEIKDGDEIGFLPPFSGG